MKLAATLVAMLAITAMALAQGPPPPTSSWSFDDGLGSFQSADPAATLTTTDDANLTRGAEHGAVLEYSYTSTPGQLAGVFGGTTANLSAAKAVRFSLRTSDPCIMLVTLNETDGSNYNAGLMSLADRWQEVAQNARQYYVENHTVAGVLPQFEQVLIDVASEARARRRH